MLSLNFNLREPKKKSATQLYAVVKYGKNQYKVSTGIKINPWQWDGKKQQPTADAENFCEILTVINNLNLGFAKEREYICQNQLSINQLINELKEINNIEMANNENLKKDGRNPKASTIIEKAWEKYVEEHTKVDGNVKCAKDMFLRFLAESGQDRQGMLSTKGLEAWKAYQLEEGRTANAINLNLQRVRFIINNYIAIDGFTRTPIAKVDFRKLQVVKKNQEDSQRNPLTAEEVATFANVECKNKKEEEARDIFTMMCLVGCRPEDVWKIYGREYQEVGGCYKYHATKNRKMAFAPLTPQIKALQVKYADGFTEWETGKVTSTLNDYIKKLTKRAGISREVTYTDNYGKTITKPFYAAVSQYWGRHTFATMRLAEGKTALQVAKMLGDTEEMVHKHYGHWTDEMVTGLIGTSTKVEITEEKARPKEDNLMNEMLRVLAFHQVPYSEYASVNSWDALYRLVMPYEDELMKKGCTREEIKDLFNHFDAQRYAKMIA